MHKPDFTYEQKYWQQGFDYVVGIDEVGRGCFAGPVVVAACAFTPISNLKSQIPNLGIDDSKRLKPKDRERLTKEIKKHALAWDITEVGVSVINKIGIGKATEKAMRKAVGDIAKLLNCYQQYNNQQPSNLFVLTDFYNIPYLKDLGRKNQKGIKKGDQKSISIAAASIIAKVHRDKLMLRLSKRYKKYSWGRNKGYGTKEHQNAILRYGLTRYHRKRFVETWLGNCYSKGYVTGQAKV